MKNSFIVVLLLIFASCSKEVKRGNMVVQGEIKGLKKGTLYLQKMKDTVIVSIDSISLLGNGSFTLSDNLESPQMYYLTFDGNTTAKRIMFFGEKGNITINDNVDKFGIAPKIEGSKNQEVMDNYYKMTRRFQNKQLDLIKANLEAQKNQNTKASDSLRKVSENLLKRRYLYSTNFAMTHADYEAAPFIALSELVDANIKLLDTIHNSLTDKVRVSLYGKKLEKFISDIKKIEK